jgi:hypothetical protein
MKKRSLFATTVLLGAISLSAYTYEVQPLIGKNFTENGAAVDDSTAFGLRINKYLSNDNAIMFGYTRLNDADYNKNIIKQLKNSRSCGVNPCAPKPQACPTKPSKCSTPQTHCSQKPKETNKCNTQTSANTNENDHQGNSSSVGSNASASSNTSMGNNSKSASNQQPHAPVTQVNKPKIPAKKLKPTSGNLGKSYKSASTDVDRFYINGLHNIQTGYNRLNPYVYAGFGYERVDDEYNDYKSQGFFDAGMGLKFALSERVNLLADVQAIKKFRDNDLDILTSVGLGFFFGSTKQVAPETTVPAVKVEPTREITIVKVKPNPMPTAKTVAVTAPKAVQSGNYYIQLAAAFKTDLETGCHYTDELKKEGIDYDIKYTTIKGKNASILVVGPYNSKDEAKEDLAKIRKIAKDAFIRRLKD